MTTRLAQPPATTARPGRAVASGALATVIVGGSVPITGLLAGYPVLPGQAIRYAIGGAVLYGWLRARGRPLPWPGRRDLLGLLGMTGTGMLGFNAALLTAQRYAEPGFVAAVLGATPLGLALVGALLRRGRPVPAVLFGAAAVVAGVLVLSGGGSWHGPGLLLAVLAMLGEIGFTVFGSPVTSRLGVVEACVWACLLAAVGGAGLGTVLAGRHAWPVPTPVQTVSLLVLGVLVTALAFGAWYTCVVALGADRAGVLVGLMPVSGFVVSVLLGAQPITVAGAAGAALVGTGCVLGLRRPSG